MWKGRDLAEWPVTETALSCIVHLLDLNTIQNKWVLLHGMYTNTTKVGFGVFVSCKHNQKCIEGGDYVYLST